MKKSIIVFFSIVLLIILSVCIIIYVKKLNNDSNNEMEEDNSSNISNIKSFYFTYSNGYAAYSYTRYEINKEDNKYIATIKKHGVPEEDAIEVKITDQSMKELESILNKYNVSKWDGFNKTDKDVLDGDSFSCSIYMENGDKISASGYMKWPDNYSEVVSELDLFFTGLIK